MDILANEAKSVRFEIDCAAFGERGSLGENRRNADVHRMTHILPILRRDLLTECAFVLSRNLRAPGLYCRGKDSAVTVPPACRGADCAHTYVAPTRRAALPHATQRNAIPLRSPTCHYYRIFSHESGMWPAPARDSRVPMAVSQWAEYKNAFAFPFLRLCLLHIALH